jgi:predicted ATPase
MRLSSFRIRNFKSIIDTGECRLSATDNILVLAGQNEAGKSAIIEALDFFANGPSRDFGRLHRRRNEHPEVVCTFALESSDLDSIPKVYNSEELRSMFKASPAVQFVRGSTSEDSFKELRFTEPTSSKIREFVLKIAELLANDKINSTPVGAVVKSNDSASSETDERPWWKQDNNSGDDAGSQKDSINKIEISIISIQQAFRSRIRTFVFFSAFSDLLPGVVSVNEIEKYPAVLDFEKLFKISFSDIVTKDNRQVAREELRLNEDATDDLNTYWTQKLTSGAQYNFTTKIVPKTPIETASEIEFMIDRNDGDPLYMEQKSAGFRWFSAFNLRLRSLEANPEMIQSLIIIIDEPGQGLHEKAQQDVKKVIEELGEKGAQVIYSTHYPNLIGTEGSEFARIRLVSNSSELGTRAESVSQFAARTDGAASDTLSPIITAMGIHSVQSIVDKNRKNIVVGGISDHYYYTAFKILFNKDPALYFLPACGVSNIPNLVSVLLGWGFDYKAVLDDDPGTGRKAYNLLKKEFYEGDDELAHKHILKLKECNGIEDLFSKWDFHKFVLNDPEGVNTPDLNSFVAGSRKEMLARLFLEKVTNRSIELSNDSESRIQAVFDWLYDKFSLPKN